MDGLVAILNRHKDKKIAIYGLSIETEKVLCELSSNFQIIGLLDGYKTDGMLYNKPIITMEQAIKMKVKLILVVARPGSCKAIAKRIAKVCVENRIDLFDIRGKDLCNIKKVSYNFRNVNGITKKELLENISEKDIVSFDLFDTLIMRQTMFSTDVLELVDYKLREQGIMIPKFQEKRLSCEKELSNHTAPTLIEIYSYMKKVYRISDIDPQRVAELEWEIDRDLIVPREEVCGLIRMINASGKKVYIVTDSYYTKKQIIKILDKCEIEGYTDILVSCEFKTGKTQKLFEILKRRIGAGSCLHIGDDEIADVMSTEKYHIGSCRLYSGIDLMEMSGYLGMWDDIESFSDRVKVGMFIAKIFNSPFQFESKKKRICVYNAYDIGYLFFAPMIGDFTLWFQEKVRENKLNNVLFSARDGYLIKKMYDELVEDDSSVYFLISRMAVIRAGIENMDDIMYVEKMKFSGPLHEQLKERFGVSVDLDDAVRHEKLSDYSRVLLDKAAKCKDGYKKYVKGLGIHEGACAFFDFVAKGTNQMYISRFLNNHLKGFYFLQLEDAYISEKGLDIESFYGSDEINDSKIFEDYYILETILTAPDPSVEEIDIEGKPIYAEEMRTEEDMGCSRMIQEGINDHFKVYLKLCPKSLREINKKLDGSMLSIIHGVSILDMSFLGLKVEDPFFNRITNVLDLI